MERFNPNKIWKPSGFSHAAMNGTLLITSGQTGRDSSGNIVGESFSAQARQALLNIKNIIEYQGRSLDDVMKLTVYVKDIRYGEEYLKILSEFFAPDNSPASTFVAITALWDESQLIEIEAIADMT